ncbi:MAG: hypothetical protein NVS4B2_29540 [Chloroflexota bacterium]
MEVVHERCCGLDVHAKTVMACLIVPGPNGKPTKEIRTFGTMTEDLGRLRTWLVEADCTHVAMESTGVYWKPIYNLLEGTLDVLVVNAQHPQRVPGGTASGPRKSRCRAAKPMSGIASGTQGVPVTSYAMAC